MSDYNIDFSIRLEKNQENYMVFFGTLDRGKLWPRMQVPMIVKHLDYKIAEVYPTGDIDTGYGWPLASPIDSITGEKRTSFLASEFLSVSYQLEIDSIPSNSILYIDNEYIGNLPQKITLEEGFHKVSISLDGYEKYEKRIEVNTDNPIHITLNKLMYTPLRN